MSWQSELEKSFGSEDREFAGHPSEEEHAEEMRRLVRAGNVPTQDVVDKARDLLKGWGCTQEHIDEQCGEIRGYLAN